MSVWALVPVKSFGLAKSRMSCLLTANQRAELAEAMLRDVLNELRQVDGLAGIAIVSSELRLAPITKEAGLRLIKDTAGDLNGALEIGRAQLELDYGRISVLVLPADLPAVTAADIGYMLVATQNPSAVVIAPAHDWGGTNALLTGPDARLAYAFGPDSYRQHLKQAEERLLAQTTLNLPRLAADLDWPEDLTRTAAEGLGPHSRAVLEALTFHPSSAAKEA
ncbi:2-phospho-L-lactate guanylyltransferase [Phyllobacterium sp. YR531]|uniref:2-phospho-L-lactate guanylyltransferase n=1 Tax=Phyllobacterium sp. YR531 TaxID=1144343 RepID=UPI00026FB1FA|nr:2-phospho-L-lactate guanylyltransferase [Phyllobacterium sp. YR531]EJN05835.1 2-phospho-L-lactate guanylyltransferase [Phyllobacterium sp. YR531]